MNEKIKQYLRNIEVEKNVEILFACETGSRAWGFPSPDSDYDVRFIYKHPKDWYLSLTEQKDSIELMLDNNEMDLSGWDFKKSLTLLAKSNVAMLERIQSPIIYVENEAFLTGIQALAQHTYSKIATMYHYLSMAKNMFEAVQADRAVKLKKLFYALRTSVACQWILERDEMPPIIFQTMLEKLDIAPSITQRIYELIELKATKSESYFHTEEKALNQFIATTIARADREAQQLPAAKGQMEVLNTFFRKILSQP